MQLMLNICEKYGQKCEIKYNPDKTNFMVLGPKRRNPARYNLRLMGSEVSQTNEMKYLGSIIDEKVSLKRHLEERRKNVERKRLERTMP
jgi:hypothetical protein